MADTGAAGGRGEAVVQLGIYRRLLVAKVRSDWQYRTSFVLLFATQALVAGLDLAVIAVLFGRVDALAGWSALEVALLFGLSGTSFAFADLLVSQVEYAGRHIQAGTFDRFLLRPMSPLLQLSALEFAFRRTGRLVQPVAVLVVAMAGSGIHWTPVKVGMVPMAVASGATVFGAIWVLTASLAFWTVDTQEFGNAFTYGGNHLAQYPIDVLGPWLRRLVVFAVPLAFVAYFPASYLLGKPDPLGLPAESAMAAPLVAVVLVLVARAVWLQALRHYRSTGS